MAPELKTCIILNRWHYSGQIQRLRITNSSHPDTLCLHRRARVPGVGIIARCLGGCWRGPGWGGGRWALPDAAFDRPSVCLSGAGDQASLELGSRQGSWVWALNCLLKGGWSNQRGRAREQEKESWKILTRSRRGERSCQTRKKGQLEERGED